VKSAINVNYARGEHTGKPQASDLYAAADLQVAGQVKTETLDSVEIGRAGQRHGRTLVFDVAAYWMDTGETSSSATATASRAGRSDAPWWAVESGSRIRYYRHLVLKGQL